MALFALFRQLVRPSMPVQPCLRCAYFFNEPQRMEKDSPGLSSLSSGYGAVRGSDGQCALHGRYVAAVASCAAHTPVTD